MQAGRRRIGTRGSPLALAQAQEVRRRLAQAHGLPESQFEIVAITTSGDRIQNRPLSEVGGKGLFTKEIEEALLAGGRSIWPFTPPRTCRPSCPDGLVIARLSAARGCPRRLHQPQRMRTRPTLPPGAIVGTSSLRRQAQVLQRAPDLRVVGLRGNVETRLRKLEDGDGGCHAARVCRPAIAWACSIGSPRPSPVELMLPAVAQGAIALEIRADDEATAKLIGAVEPSADGPLRHRRTRLSGPSSTAPAEHR